MNATSSRAHTVVTITFDQIIRNEAGSETKKSSIMNLVDLAGNLLLCCVVVVLGWVCFGLAWFGLGLVWFAFSLV